MPSHMRRYNCIDYALRSQIIHFIFNEGWSHPNTSERYSYETPRTITKALKKKWSINAQTQRRCSLSNFIRWAFSMISREASCRFSPSTSKWSFPIPKLCIYHLCFQKAFKVKLNLSSSWCTINYMTLTMKIITPSHYWWHTSNHCKHGARLDKGGQYNLW